MTSNTSNILCNISRHLSRHPYKSKEAHRDKDLGFRKASFPGKLYVG